MTLYMEQHSDALETSFATHVPAFQVEDALAKFLNCDDAIAAIIQDLEERITVFNVDFQQTQITSNLWKTKRGKEFFWSKISISIFVCCQEYFAELLFVHARSPGLLFQCHCGIIVSTCERFFQEQGRHDTNNCENHQSYIYQKWN